MANGKNYWDGFVNGLKDLSPGSLLGVGSSFLKGAIGNYFERQSLDYQAQLNEQAAVNAYNRQLDFWYKQNAYNDPSSQVRRLLDAGLNPAMINANGVNNTAGGLSSTPQASSGSPNGNKPSPTEELNALAEYAYKIKEMGFLDVQTQEKLESILTIRVDRAIKSIEGDLKLTAKEKAELDYKAFYEAYYGESIDGGAPTIPNNEYTERIKAARSSAAASDAKAALDRSAAALNEANAAYLANKDSREAMLAASECALKLAQATASYAAAAASSSQATYYSDKNTREADQLAMEQSINELREQSIITENESNALKHEIDKAWAEGVFGSDAAGHRWQNFETIVNDFFHRNFNLSGSFGITRTIK